MSLRISHKLGNDSVDLYVLSHFNQELFLFITVFLSNSLFNGFSLKFFNSSISSIDDLSTPG